MNKQTADIGKGGRGPGRPKGSQNKITVALKDAILTATEQADENGMVGYLVKQAKENPQSFLPLLGKVLPLQIAGDKENPIVTEIVQRIVHPNG